MILGARTSQGKSAFGSQIAWDVASQGINTLFISLEMYEEDLAERMFCNVMKVDNTELLHGNFSKYLKEWEEFKIKLETVPLVITDMLGRNWKDVDTYLRELDVKPKLIIIDHVQEAKDASLKSQKEIIDEYIKNLRIMAIRDDFAAVICSQINRSAQEDGNKEPQLHNLKQSGCLEEEADIVCLLHWPYFYTKKGDENKYVLNIAKNRNGRTGWLDITYKPQHYLFTDNQPQEKQAEITDWHNKEG